MRETVRPKVNRFFKKEQKESSAVNDGKVTSNLQPAGNAAMTAEIQNNSAESEQKALKGESMQMQLLNHLFELSKALRDSKKGGIGINSSRFQRVERNLNEMSYLLGESLELGGTKVELGNFFQVLKAYEELEQACESYLDRKFSAKTDAGQNRQEIVKQILGYVKADISNLNTYYDNFMVIPQEEYSNKASDAAPKVKPRVPVLNRGNVQARTLEGEKLPDDLRPFFEKKTVDFAHKKNKDLKSQVPQPNSKSTWMNGVSPSVWMVQKMTKDMELTTEERKKIVREEEERYKKGHKELRSPILNSDNSQSIPTTGNGVHVPSRIPKGGNGVHVPSRVPKGGNGVHVPSRVPKGGNGVHVPSQVPKGGNGVHVPNKAAKAGNSAGTSNKVMKKQKIGLSGVWSDPVDSIRKIDKINSFFASKDDETRIDDQRMYAIVKTLACEGRMPTAGELWGKAASLSEAENAKRIVKELPDNIWEEDSLSPEEDRAYWEEKFEEIIQKGLNGESVDRYEGDAPYRIYSNDRFFKIMNILKREKRIATAKELYNEDDPESCGPVTLQELAMAMKAQEFISEDISNGEHSQLQNGRVVYRGGGNKLTNFLKKQFAIREDDSEDVVRQKMQEGYINEEALMSSSLDIMTAKDFADKGSKEDDETGTVLQLYASRGTNVQYISPSSEYDGEYEMLFDAGTNIRIIDAVYNKGKYLQIRGAVTHGNLLGTHRKKL